jgi:hypothetical protein
MPMLADQRLQAQQGALRSRASDARMGMMAKADGRRRQGRGPARRPRLVLVGHREQAHADRTLAP